MRYKFMQVCTRPTAVVSIILSITRFQVFPAEVSVKILYAVFATFRSIIHMVFFSSQYFSPNSISCGEY